MSADVLFEKEMANLKGGRACGCGCAYADSGGSSMNDNGWANYGLGENGGHSVDVAIQYEFIDPRA